MRIRLLQTIKHSGVYHTPGAELDVDDILAGELLRAKVAVAVTAPEPKAVPVKAPEPSPTVPPAKKPVTVNLKKTSTKRR